MAVTMGEQSNFSLQASWLASDVYGESTPCVVEKDALHSFSSEEIKKLMAICNSCDAGNCQPSTIGQIYDNMETQPPVMPSRGSLGHPYLCGAPCKYTRRKSRCRDGFGCLSCHLCKWTRRTHGLRGWERIAQELTEDGCGEVGDSLSTIALSDSPSSEDQDRILPVISLNYVKFDPEGQAQVAPSLGNLLRQWPVDSAGSRVGDDVEKLFVEGDSAEDLTTYSRLLL
jgi:hypothetical protein